MAHELTHVVQQGGGTIARKVSSNYSQIRENLTYNLFDWVITDAEAHQVLCILEGLNRENLIDTIEQMKQDNLFQRFIDNLSPDALQRFNHKIKPLVQTPQNTSAGQENNLHLPSETLVRELPPIYIGGEGATSATEEVSASSGIPAFGTMASNYPLGSPEEVKEQIGGKVNYGWIENTCAIRMSRALNYSGCEIPKDKGLRSVSGADKKRYAFRVRELKQYLISQFGEPNLAYVNAEKTNTVPDSFKGVQGIIIFQVDSWSDATGHITLWDGNQCVNNDCYWEKATKVELWITGS